MALLNRFDFPAYYDDVHEMAESIAAEDNTADMVEIAFIRAKIARGHATNKDINRLIDGLMGLE